MSNGSLAITLLRRSSKGNFLNELCDKSMRYNWMTTFSPLDMRPFDTN